MSELPYTRGSRIAAEQPSESWIARRNAEQLPRVIASIVKAETSPQAYAQSGERLEIKLHKDAQDLLPDNVQNRYERVNELVNAEKARQAQGGLQER